MPKQILIVDDEPAIVSTLGEILRLQGFAVKMVSSAQNAKAALASGAFDAVITDLSMETPTAGYDVVEAAGRQSPQPAMIILSAFPDLSSDWKSHGADAFLEKPAATSDLLAKLRELLDGGVAA